MENRKSTRKIIYALLSKNGNSFRNYTYLDNLLRFLGSCEEPQIFYVIFNDKKNAERLKINGKEFLATEIKESWLR